MPPLPFLFPDIRILSMGKGKAFHSIGPNASDLISIKVSRDRGRSRLVFLPLSLFFSISLLLYSLILFHSVIKERTNVIQRRRETGSLNSSSSILQCPRVSVPLFSK